jgi:peptidoglycan/LPS O-acetylase OafA/YrhL
VFLISLSFLGFISVLLNSEVYAPFLYWVIIPAIGFIPNPIARHFIFFRSRDFSYGFYLWAFPIQQLVMHLGIANNDVSLSIIAFPVTLLFSVGSWYLIENPAMRYGRRLLNEP